MTLRIETPEEASPYKLLIKICYFDLLSFVKVCHITDTACSLKTHQIIGGGERVENQTKSASLVSESPTVRFLNIAEWNLGNKLQKWPAVFVEQPHD